MSGPMVKCRLDLRRRTLPVAAPRVEAGAAAEAAMLASPRAPTTPGRTPTPAARVLALAHFIERELRARRWTSYRDAARALGVSHTRVQHIVGLLFLPAAVQAEVLVGRSQFSERALRPLAAAHRWPGTS